MPQDTVPSPAAISETPWLRKKNVRIAGLAAATILIVYSMVYVDVVLRAREAYLEGEKYMSWHENPALKTEALNEKFQDEKKELDNKLSNEKITQNEYVRFLEIAEFDRDRLMQESSVKYAYVWYQTAYELFSPPESKWVKLSRQKAPLAKEEWKNDLRAKKIPFEEYMLE